MSRVGSLAQKFQCTICAGTEEITLQQMAASEQSQQIDLGELELPQLQQIKTQLEEVRDSQINL